MPHRRGRNARQKLDRYGVSVSTVLNSALAPAGSGQEHLSIQFGGYRETDFARALPLLHELAGTIEVAFFGEVTDDDLRHLVGLQNILSLEPGVGGVTDAGLRHISGLTSLQVLKLRRLPITSEGMRHLTELTNLRTLELSNTQVGDDGLAILPSLPGLRHLEIDHCPVTDRGLECVADLVNLESLELSGTRVTGDGFSSLRGLVRLNTLRFNLLPVADRAAGNLSRMERLHTLSAHETQIGDEGAPWLAGLRALRWVDLSNTRVGDESLENLKDATGPLNLNLDGTRVTPAGLARLPNSIHSLGLTRLPFSEKDVAQIPDVASLTLDAQVATDAVVQRLRRRGLAVNYFQDSDVAYFSRLPLCPICSEVIDEEDATFTARPFALGPEFDKFVETPIHWGCYADWEKRPQFAQRYFEASVAACERNAHWGVAQSDAQVLLSVNPSPYVATIQVLLAATGSSLRISLDDWEEWIGGAWFESCRHAVEREALAELIAEWKRVQPTAEAVIRSAGLMEGSPGPAPTPLVERISYEMACEKLAKRVMEKGLACPGCGDFSNEYQYRRVKAVSVDGPKSVLVCGACGHEFGPGGS